MTQCLASVLLKRFLEDLRMRQAEFKTDHTISTALSMAIRETERQLQEHQND